MALTIAGRTTVTATFVWLANQLHDEGTFTYTYDVEGNLDIRTRKTGTADDFVVDYEFGPPEPADGANKGANKGSERLFCSACRTH